MDAIVAVSKADADWDRRFHDFLQEVRGTYAQRLTEHGPHLFTTYVSDHVWRTYLDGFGEMGDPQRQEHRCNCCHRFFKQYGHLVVITAEGRQLPALWDAEAISDPLYAKVVARLELLVSNAKITSAFITDKEVMGKAYDGGYEHFALPTHAANLSKDKVHRPHELMAQSIEDQGTLLRGLEEYPAEIVDKTIALLDAGGFVRSTQTHGPAMFLQKIHQARAALKGTARRNIVWKLARGAHGALCRPKTSVLGALMDDVAAGLDIEQIKRRNATLLDPHNYLRPKAAPAEGAITRGENLIEKLQLKDFLPRRQAPLDDLVTLWRPQATEKPAAAEGVFGALRKKQGQGTVLNEQLTNGGTLSWSKFARTVLPNVAEMRYLVKHRPENYFMFTAAVNADAEPILRWDSHEQRHTVSSYTYHRNTSPTQWGLMPDQWVNVQAVAESPEFFYVPRPIDDVSPIRLVLEGCVDAQEIGMALFPETLRHELNEIRAVIEAYSQATPLNRVANAAGGLQLTNDMDPQHLQVTLKSGIRVDYLIDRLD